uniref:Uncharacterized protein n=1 Tax=Oryza rufipogon TaxID=4529 RepID=A0A0E0QLU6_ORYRU
MCDEWETWKSAGLVHSPFIVPWPNKRTHTPVATEWRESKIGWGTAGVRRRGGVAGARRPFESAALPRWAEKGVGAGAGAGGGGFSGSACGWEESKYTTNGEYEGWADGDVACRACFGADGFAVNPALLQLVLQIASKVTTKK